MVLENVKEMWTETPRVSGGKKGRPVNKDRFISKMWVHILWPYFGVSNKTALLTFWYTGFCEVIRLSWCCSVDGFSKPTELQIVYAESAKA